MAFRVFASTVCRNQAVTNYMLKPKNPMIINVRKYDSHIWPFTPFLEAPQSMFSTETIMKFYEVIPIITIATLGFTCEMLYTLREALTRDDVRYRPRNGKMACELEMKKGQKPPVKKLIVINQKYEVCDAYYDAVAALKEPTEAEMKEIEARKKKAASKKKK